MTEGYYCRKCNKYVMTSTSYFQHPDLGRSTCRVCRACGTMVYLKEQPELETA